MTASLARRPAMVILAYLGPLALIPLVAERGDADLQWHARHGLLLMLVEVVVLLSLTALAGVTALSNAAFGITLGGLAWIAWVAVLAIHLTAMLTAFNGKRLALPYISELADRIAKY